MSVSPLDSPRSLDASEREAILKKEQSEIDSNILHDRAALEPEPLEEDMYGMTIVSFVRDSFFISRNKAGFSYTNRLARLIITWGLLYLTMAIQIFLLVQIKTFITASAARSIKESYSQYEVGMYAKTTTDTCGWEHGVEGFDAKRFDQLDPELQASACRIPLSQPKFCFVILFIWTLVVFGDIKGAVVLGWRLLWDLPRSESGSMKDALSRVHDDDVPIGHDMVIDNLTRGVKTAIGVLILLPRLAIDCVLLWLGCRWLVSTNDFNDIVLNAVALEFILVLKDALYMILVPDRSKRDCGATLVRPARKTVEPTTVDLVGTYSWALLSAAWVFSYMYVFQRVLPGYHYDVARVCEQWIEKEYAVCKPS